MTDCKRIFERFFAATRQHFFGNGLEQATDGGDTGHDSDRSHELLQKVCATR